jgi:hypothetical protein
MENFTIHIFGYGETQINSKDLSLKVRTDTLKTVQAVINQIFSKKPADNPALITNFHGIHIFDYNEVKWNGKYSFVDIDDADLKPLVDSLIAELQTAKDITPKPAHKRANENSQKIATPPESNMDAPKS